MPRAGACAGAGPAPCKLAAFREARRHAARSAVRIITLNVNGIRSAERHGLARWLARAEPWDVVCLQEIKATHADVPRALQGAAQVARGLPSGASARATAASRVYAKTPPRFVDGLRQPRIRRRRPLSRGAFRRSSPSSASTCRRGRAARTARRRSSASSTQFLPHLAQLAQERARNHPLRRLEHRAPGDRPQELAQQPEELGLPARGARVAHARVRRAGLRRRVPPRRPAARPVHVVVEPRRRRGRRTSAGGSTTRSRRRASPPRRRAASIYTNRRFSDHAPLVDRLRLRAAVSAYRCCASPTSPSPAAPSACSTARTSPSTPATRSASSGRTAPASRACSR